MNGEVLCILPLTNTISSFIRTGVPRQVHLTCCRSHGVFDCSCDGCLWEEDMRQLCCRLVGVLWWRGSHALGCLLPSHGEIHVASRAFMKSADSSWLFAQVSGTRISMPLDGQLSMLWCWERSELCSDVASLGQGRVNLHELFPRVESSPSSVTNTFGSCY